MAGYEDAAEQATVSAVVTRDDNGTAWLNLREGGRYFDVTITGDWQGRATLEVRTPENRTASTISVLGVFEQNTLELFYLERDSDVRLWVRKGDYVCGEMRLELGT